MDSFFFFFLRKIASSQYLIIALQDLIKYIPSEPQNFGTPPENYLVHQRRSTVLPFLIDWIFRNQSIWPYPFVLSSYNWNSWSKIMKDPKRTLSCPESFTKKFSGTVTSKTCKASWSSSLVSFLSLKALWFPYTAFVITSPPVSSCLFVFLFATFCSNCWAFSAAALASRTCGHWKQWTKHNHNMYGNNDFYFDKYDANNRIYQ